MPLYTAAAFGKAATHLNPVFSIRQENMVLSTAELAGVAISSLGDRVGFPSKNIDMISLLPLILSSPIFNSLKRA